MHIYIYCLDNYLKMDIFLLHLSYLIYITDGLPVLPNSALAALLSCSILSYYELLTVNCFNKHRRMFNYVQVYLN